jgi:septal ring factor EnvC (AmiA/AmiB activator)
MSFNPFANKADLEAAQSQIASLTEDLTAAQAELSAERETVAAHAQSISDLQAQVATLTAERDTSAESLTQAQAQIVTLQEEVQIAEASAEQKAITLLSQNGHEAPVAIQEESAIKNKTLQQFNALTPADRMNFVKTGGKIIN